MTYSLARCRVLYINFLYNFWLEFTLLNFPFTPKSVTIKKLLILPLYGPYKVIYILSTATIA